MARSLYLSERALQRYGFSVCAVFASTLLCIVLGDHLGLSVPMIVFFPAVVAALLFGGAGPGCLATALTLLVGLGLMSHSKGRLEATEIVRLAIIVFSSLAACAMVARREHRLRMELHALSAAMACAVEGIAELSLNGLIVSVNDQFGLITGSNPITLTKRPLLELVYQPDRPVVADAMRQALRSAEKTEVTARVMWRGAAPHDVSMMFVSSASGEGRLRGLYCFMQDTTERKRQQEELRQTKERLQVAFEHSIIPMAVTETDGRFVDVNGALCRLLGYEADELRLMNVQMLTHPDDLDQQQMLTRDMREGNISHFTMHKRYIHKSGRSVWVAVSKMAVHDQNGVPSFFVSQVQDLTRERELQNELDVIRAVDNR